MVSSYTAWFQKKRQPVPLVHVGARSLSNWLDHHQCLLCMRDTIIPHNHYQNHRIQIIMHTHNNAYIDIFMLLYGFPEVVCVVIG